MVCGRLSIGARWSMALRAITGCANSTSRPRPTVASPLSLVPTSDAIADDLPSVTVNANFDRFELQVRFEAIQMVDLAGGVMCSTDTDSASGQLTSRLFADAEAVR